MPRILPHLALLLAMLTWSSSFIALKIGLSAYTPLEVMAGRMLIATLVCLPVLRHLLRALQDKNVRRLLLLSVLCEPCLYFLCETFALRNTSSAQAGMIIALLPLFVAGGAWLWLSERLGRRTWLGFALAVAGVALLSAKAVATDNSPNPVLGNALEMVAVFCATGYTLIARRLTDKLSPIVLTSAMSFAGAIFFVPLALLPLPITPLPLDVPMPAWMPACSIIYLGSVVTFLGYGLYNYGISRLSAGRAAAYTNLIPIITLVMGVAWLGDVLAPAQYAASGLVILGIVLSQYGGRAYPKNGTPEAKK